MKRIKSYLLGGVTFLSALGIGYVMQYGLALPAQNEGEPPVRAALEVTGITPTSSAAVVPGLPVDMEPDLELPGHKVVLAAADSPGLPGQTPNDAISPDMPGEMDPAGFACDVTMTAEPTAGAMVDLQLTAPCNASERVTIHHQGLMFTEIVQPDGTLSVRVPVLSERATFLASFAGGAGGMAVADVSSLPFYDRVAVQWKGEAGLQLHAREYDAAYFADGHIWAAASGDLASAARGEGGFLVRLGRVDTPESLVAEIYSFPTGTARRGGEVALTVEAEVTAANCADRVEAQTLEIRDGERLRVRDLTLHMPGCDATGDFLVLKNLVEDLKIAAR